MSCCSWLHDGAASYYPGAYYYLGMGCDVVVVVSLNLQCIAMHLYFVISTERVNISICVYVLRCIAMCLEPRLSTFRYGFKLNSVSALEVTPLEVSGRCLSPGGSHMQQDRWQSHLEHYCSTHPQCQCNPCCSSTLGSIPNRTAATRQHHALLTASCFPRKRKLSFNSICLSFRYL